MSIWGRGVVGLFIFPWGAASHDTQKNEFFRLISLIVALVFCPLMGAKFISINLLKEIFDVFDATILDDVMDIKSANLSDLGRTPLTLDPSYAGRRKFFCVLLVSFCGDWWRSIALSVGGGAVR